MSFSGALAREVVTERLATASTAGADVPWSDAEERCLEVLG